MKWSQVLRMAVRRIEFWMIVMLVALGLGFAWFSAPPKVRQTGNKPMTFEKVHARFPDLLKHLKEGGEFSIGIDLHHEEDSDGKTVRDHWYDLTLKPMLDSSFSGPYKYGIDAGSAASSQWHYGIVMGQIKQDGTCWFSLMETVDESIGATMTGHSERWEGTLAAYPDGSFYLKDAKKTGQKDKKKAE